FSGPASGVGATMAYDSDNPQVGDGSWKIVASEPRRSVTYALENQQRGHDKTMTFHLKPTGRGGRNVEITQNYDVEYGWDLMGRYAGLYVSRHVGDDMKLGLDRLANMLAQVPNTDYAVQGSTMSDLQFVELPAEDLLVVSAGAIERNNLKIQNAMKADLEWINRTIKANNLVATGPMRIVTSDFGRENYTFDVAVPVRRADAAVEEGADEDAAAEQPAADEAVADAAAQGAARLDHDPGRGRHRPSVRGLQERHRQGVHRRRRVRRLLDDQVRPEGKGPMTRYARGFDTGAAFAYLEKRDRKLGAWMRRLGPIGPDPRWRKRFDPVDALARAIMYQQLSGKAAATIVGRIEAAIGSDRFHCDTLARIDDAGLRACGASGNKTLALRD